MRSIKFILEIFKKFPGLLSINILMSFMVILMGAGSLFSIGPLIDFLIHPDLQGISPLTAKAIRCLELFRLPVSLISWLVILTVFLALTSIFQIAVRFYILKIKYSVLRQIILGTFEDFFAARWQFFTGGKQGVLLNTFTREISNVGDAFGAIATFFSNILQLGFFLFIPFLISWKVTLISLGAALGFAIPFILLGRISYRLGNANTATANRMMGVLQENLSLAKVVLGFANQGRAAKDLGEAFDRHCEVTLKSQVLERAIGLLYRPLGIVTVAVALLAAQRIGVPLAESAVLLLALTQVATTIGDITTQKNSLDNFFPSYEQVVSLRSKAKSLKQQSGDGEFLGFNKELRLEKITFAYPGHAAVLKELSVTIPKGKMIAFVGEFGAGKSTLIDLIIGFNKPLSGKVTLDGLDLEKFDILSFRKKIGYVPQDSVLFNLSIRDNLLWSNPQAGEKEIRQACRLANAEEFIQRFPDGYDTLTGDRGVRLSGGQIQRLALARAILRQPELLILDEATSALDTGSERMIQQAIENIAKQTTVIVIAHRLSTIMNASYIYVLDRGRIIEEGNYLRLMNSNGSFQRMVKLQMLGEQK